MEFTLRAVCPKATVRPIACGSLTLKNGDRTCINWYFYRATLSLIIPFLTKPITFEIPSMHKWDAFYLFILFISFIYFFLNRAPSHIRLQCHSWDFRPGETSMIVWSDLLHYKVGRDSPSVQYYRLTPSLCLATGLTHKKK